MEIPRDAWAIIFAQRNDVIESDHPDYEHWMEAQAVEEMADGAPPLEAVEPPSGPKKSPRPPVPTLALNLKDAATALDVSDEFFREHIKSELRIVRRGRRQFISRAELDRWLAESSEPT